MSVDSLGLRSAASEPDHALARFWLWVAAALSLLLAAGAGSRLVGFDSHAYWLVWHHGDVYGLAPNQQDAFVYSPAFAQLLWPLAQLPWPLFAAIWTAAGLAVYAWLLWPLDWRWRGPLLLLCAPQALVGNIWPVFAVVAVFGFRRAELWAVPLLTKVTAGVGLVWFAARHEWRSLLRAALATGAVVAVSVAISPGLWFDWLHLLTGGGRAGTPAGAWNVPLVFRLPLALGLAVYAAKRNRPAVLVATIGLASPVFTLSWLLSWLVPLAALPRLRREY